MASILTRPSADAKGSKIPIPQPATSDSTVLDFSTSQVKKPTFQTRKSAEELKLRLASAVSAKIALGKDGRTSSNNRGIGFLLQRKEQENRLNTKDISFQKSVRNGGDKTVETKGKSPNTSVKNIRSEINKTELQKSLLSALMNSRAPSGVNSGQTRVKDTRLGTASKLNTTSTNKEKSRTNEPNRRPVATSKVINGNTGKESKLDSRVSSERSSGFGNGIKMDSSDTTSKTIESGLKTRTLPLSSEETSRNAKSKLQMAGNVNGQVSRASGKILERAKNIESLLGQRQQNNESVEPTAPTKDGPEPKQGINRMASAVLDDKNNKSLKLNTTDRTAQSIENSGKGRTAINNGMNYEKLAQNKTVETRKSEDNFGKKIPPPVAKKPSKEIKGSSSQFQRKISPSRVNGLGLTGKEHALNRVNSVERKAFREDLLEKLEADVGDCKIAAFQSMEDFSALRIRVYRIRGDLDQLKRDREKRTPLVC